MSSNNIGKEGVGTLCRLKGGVRDGMDVAEGVIGSWQGVVLRRLVDG